MSSGGAPVHCDSSLPTWRRKIAAGPRDTRALVSPSGNTAGSLVAVIRRHLLLDFIVKLLCCFIVDCGENQVVVVHQSWRAKCLDSPLFKYVHTRTVLK